MSKYFIYEHISPSGKRYIGQTCVPIKQRWGKNGSSYLRKRDGKYMHPILASAILKYGWDNFTHKILFSGLSSLEADMIEEDLVHYYRSKGLSYNAVAGGVGTKSYTPSTDTLEKRSASMKRYWDGEENTNIKEMIKKTLTEVGKNTRYTKDNYPDRSRPVLQLTLSGELIAEYPSAAEAGRLLNRRREGIKDCCNKRQKTAYGYKWEYKK